MKRRLLRSPSFLRAAKRLIKKDRILARDVKEALTLLADDPFHPQLRTHKLKGKLEGTWACSAGYDLRILFSFADQDGTEAILLETVGTHGEVY